MRHWTACHRLLWWSALPCATLAAALAAGADPADRQFGNRFGLQLRAAPPDGQSVWAPAILRPGPANESCLLARSDGTLECYAITQLGGRAAEVIRSRDGGLTWGAAEEAFALPGAAYHAIRVLEAADGTLHAVFHVRGEGPGGYRGVLYEVYYTRRAKAAAAWTPPRRVVTGYVGSIRGFTQVPVSGRLILAVARAIPERQVAPKSGPDFGWNDTFVYVSNDDGTTWRESPDRLSIELRTPNVTRYGAIEPVLLPLRDGRVWMLVRDRGGRLWQSFSAEGERWPALTPSTFISSDSPAELVRLRNGKIVLFVNACQNWGDPRSYAMGGREVLLAAVSADEGATWHGFREVFHETNGRVARGDRGTAYASAAETALGKLVVVSGQGDGKRGIFTFDPRWLEEKAVRDDPVAGPVQWTSYGADDVRSDSRAIVIPLPLTATGGAAWNFPLAGVGSLSLQLTVPPSARDLELCLNDHFNRIDDRKAGEHAVYRLPLTTVVAGRHELRLRWAGATRGGALDVELDGRALGAFPAQRSAVLGVNYLRLTAGATAPGTELKVAALAAQIP